jgi:hypothetical protein
MSNDPTQPTDWAAWLRDNAPPGPLGRNMISAAAEIDRLRSGIQAMLDGNYPHPRAYRSAPGMECPHGIPYYQDCGACNDAWLQGLLS